MVAYTVLMICIGLYENNILSWSVIYSPILNKTINDQAHKKYNLWYLLIVNYDYNIYTS